MQTVLVAHESSSGRRRKPESESQAHVTNFLDNSSLQICNLDVKKVALIGHKINLCCNEAEAIDQLYRRA
jgi:hypothetical protein